MEENQQLTPLQQLRQELSAKLRHLPDYKIIAMCQDYGITYEIADANTLRIFMLLCSAEEMILSMKSEAQ